MKLKNKFIMSFTVFALIPLIISGIIISYVCQNSSKNDAYIRLKEELLIAQSSMRNNIDMLKKIALSSQNDDLIISYLNDDSSTELKTKVSDKYKVMKDNYELFANIIILNSEGIAINDANKSTNLNTTSFNTTPYFLKAKETKQMAVSSAVFGKLVGKPVMVICVPILNNEKQIQGYTMFNVNLEAISDKNVTNIKIGSSGYVYAMDYEGNMLMHPNKEEINQKKILETKIGQEILTKKSGIGEYKNNNANLLVAYGEDKDMGLIYAANIPTSEFMGTAKTVMYLILGISIIAFIISSIFSVLISKSIVNRINSVANAMENVAKGDFTTKVHVKNKDEISSMGSKINETMNQLRFSISGVKENSSNVNNMSTTLASTSKQMTMAASGVALAVEEIAGGAVNQTRELLEITNQLDMFNSELNDIHVKISNVHTSSKDTESKAIHGKDYIESLTQSILKIKQSFSEVNTKINGLGSTVSEIGKITDSINEISEQTNLLALNAAIEAARAGEQGKGFAVVAEEVRKLAEESSKASGEIMNLINSVSNETNEVINTSKQMDDLIEEQTDVVEKTIQSFDNILESVQNIAPMVNETYNSVKNAIKAKDIVVDKIDGISSVAEKVAASTQEISASAEEMLSSTEEVADIALKLDESVNDLTSKVEGFKVQ